MATTLSANIKSVTAIIEQSHVFLGSMRSVLASPPEGFIQVAQEALKVGPNAVDPDWARKTMLDEKRGKWLSEIVPDTIHRIDAARAILNQTAKTVRKFATETAAVDDANVWLGRVAVFLQTYWCLDATASLDDRDWQGPPLSPAQRWASSLLTSQKIVFEKSLNNETAGELISIDDLLRAIDRDKLINRLLVEADKELAASHVMGIAGTPAVGVAAEHTVQPSGVNDSTTDDLKTGAETNAQPLTAVTRLIGWSEILNALDRLDSDLERIKSLNHKYDGPIRTRQGGDPMVARNDLINWWNRLEDQFDEHQRRAADRRATVSENATYQHGKSGHVAPEISGEVKTSRKRTPKTT